VIRVLLNRVTAFIEQLPSSIRLDPLLENDDAVYDAAYGAILAYEEEMRGKLSSPTTTTTTTTLFSVQHHMTPFETHSSTTPFFDYEKTSNFFELQTPNLVIDVAPGKECEADLKRHLEHAHRTDKLVVIDFFANWHAPCKRLDAMLTKVAEQLPRSKVCFLRVDVDQCPSIQQSWAITTVPTIKFVKNTRTLYTCTSKLELQSQQSLFRFIQLLLEHTNGKSQLNELPCYKQVEALNEQAQQETSHKTPWFKIIFLATLMLPMFLVYGLISNAPLISLLFVIFLKITGYKLGSMLIAIIAALFVGNCWPNNRFQLPITLFVQKLLESDQSAAQNSVAFCFVI